MTTEQAKGKKLKVAWGITGAGDKIAEFIEVMKNIKKEYEATVDIHVFVSRAGETVLKFYGLETTLRTDFEKVRVEINSNSPFLAAWMQTHKYDLLLIAPATSNTVAKITNGIGDTMLTNAAIMSLKAFVPVYIVPTDYKEGVVYTKLPNGKEMKLRVRKEEAYQVDKLREMEDVHVLDGPMEIPRVFKMFFTT
ncbi:TPA: archaeoflavoprotein AfpA [Candidatus Bathyarchaeota archaeon]|nr:archaeoflavoprotein AfpA [Candidatus Bathyarchaeota archaeon]